MKTRTLMLLVAGGGFLWGVVVALVLTMTCGIGCGAIAYDDEDADVDLEESGDVVELPEDVVDELDVPDAEVVHPDVLDVTEDSSPVDDAVSEADEVVHAEDGRSEDVDASCGYVAGPFEGSGGEGAWLAAEVLLSGLEACTIDACGSTGVTRLNVGGMYVAGPCSSCDGTCDNWSHLRLPHPDRHPEGLRRVRLGPLLLVGPGLLRLPLISTTRRPCRAALGRSPAGQASTPAHRIARQGASWAAGPWVDVSVGGW